MFNDFEEDRLPSIQLRGSEGGKRGPLAEAVNVFFDRRGEALPQFVPRGPSIRISILAGVVTLLVGLLPVRMEMIDKREERDPLLRNRWMVFLASLFLASYIVQAVVQDRVYTVTMYKLNSQHFANLYWLRKYMRAFRHVPLPSLS